MYIYILYHTQRYTYIHEWSRCRKADRESSSGIQQCPRWQLVPRGQAACTSSAAPDANGEDAAHTASPGRRAPCRGCCSWATGRMYGRWWQIYATARSGLFWVCPGSNTVRRCPSPHNFCSRRWGREANSHRRARARRPRSNGLEGAGAATGDGEHRYDVLWASMSQKSFQLRDVGAHSAVLQQIIYIYISQLFLLIIPYHHVIYVVTINSTKHQFGPNKLR